MRKDDTMNESENSPAAAAHLAIRQADVRRDRRRDPLMAGERNDCTVRALWNATGTTYREAHDYLRINCNRQPTKRLKRRATVSAFDSGGNVLGCTFTRVIGATGQNGIKRGRMTVARFIRENPKGRFYCAKKGHAFAIVDGELVDSRRVKFGALINSAWIVAPAMRHWYTTQTAKTAPKTAAKTGSDPVFAAVFSVAITPIQAVQLPLF